MSAAAPPPQVSEHATDLQSGPFSLLYASVKNNTHVLVNVRNNHKLLARVKAYDRHMNLYVRDECLPACLPAQTLVWWEW